MIHWGKNCDEKLKQVEQSYQKELERTNVDFLHQLTTYKLQIQSLNEEIRKLKEAQSTYKTPDLPNPIQQLFTNECMSVAIPPNLKQITITEPKKKKAFKSTRYSSQPKNTATIAQ